MLPSSAVSVGMLPSNRTLVVGVVQVVMSSLVTLEQSPTADDPFTDTTSSVAKEKLDGKTTGGIVYSS